jgi:hypothetical protein
MMAADCGLPNPYYLNAPTVPTLAAGATSTVTFVSPGYNQPGSQTTFTGFEVYYKFLASTPVGTDINLGGGGFPGPSVLQSNGYMPICLATNNPPYQRTAPAIAIAFADSVNSLSITLTLSSSGPSSTNYGSSPELGRNVSYTSSPRAKAFAANSSGYPSTVLGPSNYDFVNDNDLKSVTPTANQIYVNLYVLAYGLEQGTSVVEYSTPTYMGFMILPYQ